MIGYQYYRSTLGAWKQNIKSFRSSTWIPSDPSSLINDETAIVVYIEAVEPTHENLNQDSRWHPMSLIVAGTKLCPDCVKALAGHGITDTDTMFSAARKLQKIHRGLAPQRF